MNKPDSSQLKRRRFLAPSLASVLVLLAAIGLSRNLATSLPLTGQEGRTPGLKVESDDFRFGSLHLARQLILGQGFEPGTQNKQTMDLTQAVKIVGDMVQKMDEPSQPIGSSSIILISARDIRDIAPLEALVHQRATEGITLSMFPLGNTP